VLHLIKAKKFRIFLPIKNLMKLSTQVFTSLMAALATLSQSAIATYKPTNSAKSEPLIENSSQVKSVQQVREQIRGQLNFQKWCDTKGCIAPRTIEVCKLVDVLNSRVSGKIFKPEIKSEKELKIGKSDLQLMRKIWNHCRLVPASDLQIGTKGMLRVYSPQRCKDGNEISQLLRLPSADCSYEKYLSPLKK
jgi:hypothetical protein